MSMLLLKRYIYENSIDDAAIAARIVDRMYLNRASSQVKTMPYVVWRETNSQPQDNFADANRIERHFFEFACVSTTPDEANDVAQTFIDKWKRFSGELGPVGGVGSPVQADSRYLDLSEAPSPHMFGMGQGKFVVLANFSFWVKNT